MKKSNQDTPIYLQSTKEQRAVKPPIEDVCEYFLKDNVLRDGMARLLEISREQKMKPSWMQINGYKCSYKGKGVVSYVIGGSECLNDHLIVSVSLADREDLESVIFSLPDDIIEELQNREHTHCRVCAPASCPYGGFAYQINGETRYLCSRFNYMCKNPTAEQFEIIARLIMIRRGYVEAKKK